MKQKAKNWPKSGDKSPHSKFPLPSPFGRGAGGEGRCSPRGAMTGHRSQIGPWPLIDPPVPRRGGDFRRPTGAASMTTLLQDLACSVGILPACPVLKHSLNKENKS